MRDNEIPWKTAVQIIEDVTKHITFQSYRFPYIHDNRALILGSTVSINVTKDGSIVIFLITGKKSNTFFCFHM
jgi:muramoyltetrapeptide carboxypeptidase